MGMASQPFPREHLLLREASLFWFAKQTFPQAGAGGTLLSLDFS